MAKLILHAGVHRTGTTSIQNYLAHNRQALLEQGYRYPGDAGNHQDLAWKLIKGAIGADEFVAAVTDKDGRTVIVSAEDLCRIEDQTLIAAIASQFEVQVVLFVRRQDEWVESWYNQHLKWPFSRTASAMSPLQFLGTLPEYHWLYYDRLHDRWSAACRNVDLVVFDEIDNSIAAFCGRVGIDQKPLQQPRGKTNSSLSAATLEVVRHLGLYDLSQPLRAITLRTLERTTFANRQSGPIFPASIKRLIMDHFSDSNQRLAETILGRSDPVLFPPGDDYPFAAATLPGSQALLRDFVAPLLRQIDRRLQKRS